ncbi:MAG: asparagine synthase-related protein [Nannocystaceae bacterium]
MTGICGIVQLRGPAGLAADCLAGPRAHLDRYIDAGCAVYRGRGVELAQHLHAQVPEAVGQTGCVELRDAQLVIAGDMRLDNRNELGSSLGLDPLRSSTWPDEAFVLRAHLRWGPQAAERLLGDFCYALWDARQRELHLVRDPVGIRPCYYFVSQTDPGSFVFASSLPGLLSHASAPRDICEDRIADFLTLHDNLENTFYRGIKRVPPGHRVRIRGQRVELHRYYQMTLPPVLRLQDPRAYHERFREILVEATLCRLRSPSKPAILLSGGLDSASIAGIVRERGPSPVQEPIATFSGLFPDYPNTDEKAWVELVLERGRFSPHYRRLDHESPLAHLERDLEVHGQPFYCPNNYTDTALLDCAQQAGTTLLLDGIDGDTTVGHGFEFFGQLLREGRLRRLYRHARGYSRHVDQSAWWFIRTHALRPTFLGLRQWMSKSRSPRPPRHVAPAFADRMRLAERLRERRAARSWTLLSPYREQHWGKLRSEIIPMSCELIVEQGMSRRIVRRHPYLDRRLIEFCLSLPPEQRLGMGADRIVQRRAVEPFVPRATARRLTKSNFEQNFADRIVTHDAPRLRALRGARTCALDTYVHRPALNSAIDTAFAGVATSEQLIQIWMASILDVWLSAR